MEGVAWRPAVRCKSDAAERFDPAATVFGVGMPADGEDSIEGQGKFVGKQARWATVFSAREKRNIGKRPGGSNSGVGVGVDARVAGISQISISRMPRLGLAERVRRCKSKRLETLKRMNSNSKR